MSSVSTPSAQVALLACVLASSSTSSPLKPAIVPAKACGSLSRACPLAPKASVWPVPTADCSVIDDPAAIDSSPAPVTVP